MSGMRLEVRERRATGKRPDQHRTSDQELLTVTCVYRDLLRYRKWGDAELLRGQVHLINDSPDSAYLAARMAMNIFEKIGNSRLTVCAKDLATESLRRTGRQDIDGRTSDSVDDISGRYVYREDDGA